MRLCHTRASGAWNPILQKSSSAVHAKPKPTATSQYIGGAGEGFLELLTEGHTHSCRLPVTHMSCMHEHLGSQGWMYPQEPGFQIKRNTFCTLTHMPICPKRSTSNTGPMPAWRPADSFTQDNLEGLCLCSSRTSVHLPDARPLSSTAGR